MFDHKPLQKTASYLSWALLLCAVTYSQQEPRHGARQHTETEAEVSGPDRPADLVSDNLEKAAASADQILEVVNKEVGLAVELKRLLAQDAGANGQIVEESDLTDLAVAERLRSDLRSRVLATRLLQRYGYLVPRMNPDSDQGVEQKFVQQERAQMLARAAERAAERRDTLADNPIANRDAECGADCALPSSAPVDRESLPVTPTGQNNLLIRCRLCSRRRATHRVKSRVRRILNIKSIRRRRTPCSLPCRLSQIRC